MNIKSGIETAPNTEPSDWLSRAARQIPQAPALYWGKRVLSYRRMQRHCLDIVSDINAYGHANRPLALACSSRLDTAFGLWAGLYCHTPVLPLNCCHPESRPLLQQCSPGLWLADGGNGHPFVTHNTRSGLPSSASHDIRLIIATSGSTGDPRGVMLSAANLTAAVDAANSRIPLNTGDIWLQCLPLEHIGGLSILLRCARAGAAVLLHPDFDPVRIMNDLRRIHITHLSLTPAMLHQLLRASDGQTPPPTLRSLLIGGAVLNPELERQAREAGWPLCISYGMSETASQVATRCDAADAQCVGSLLDGFEVRISKPDGMGMGEIQLRGPALMSGYVNPSLEPGRGLVNGWLHTGDFGRLNQGGRLYVQGRADDLLNSAGVRLHPIEVEPVLRGAPGVDDALLSARTDPIWGDLLIAAYTGMAAPDALLKHCRRHLPKTHLPRECRRMESLPYLDSGKPDRRRLRSILDPDYPYQGAPFPEQPD